jgi:hypothetical protein
MMEWWNNGMMGKGRCMNPLFQSSIIPIFYFLDVTRQTIIGHFVLGMAIHTPFHGHLHPWLGRRFFALSNLSVTGLAW